MPKEIDEAVLEDLKPKEHLWVGHVSYGPWYPYLDTLVTVRKMVEGAAFRPDQDDVETETERVMDRFHAAYPCKRGKPEHLKSNADKT